MESKFDKLYEEIMNNRIDEDIKEKLLKIYGGKGFRILNEHIGNILSKSEPIERNNIIEIWIKKTKHNQNFINKLINIISEDFNIKLSKRNILSVFEYYKEYEDKQQGLIDNARQESVENSIFKILQTALP